MAHPAALVKISLRTLRAKSSAVGAMIAVTHKAYALAFIGNRRIGRTSHVTATGGLDFDKERGTYSREVRVAAGESIPVRVEVWSTERADAPALVVFDSVAPPWETSQRKATTELELTYDVDTRLVPASQAAGVVPRAAQGTTTQGTLRLGDAVVVEIVDAPGVYEPEPNPRLGKPNARRRQGYIGEDDKGRVYLNRDVDGRFVKDLQVFELHAKLTVVRGFMPANARVRWRVLDADDPSNDDPGMHAEAGIYVDRLDYDGSTGDHLGSRGFDNEGQFDRDPRFEQVKGFALEVANEGEARTAIVGHESKLRVHCTNIAGDNLVVRADVIADGSFEVFAHETGILSMWHRIDVEYVRMKSAFPMPVENVAGHFEPAFVQMDFTAPRVVPDIPFIANSEARLGPNRDAYINVVFQHKNEPGWFCLIGAMRAYPSPPPPGPLFDGRLPIQVLPSGEDEFIEFPGSHADAYVARFQWGAPAGEPQPHAVEFIRKETQVRRDPQNPRQKITRMVLWSHDFSPLFVAGDLGPSFFFGLRRQQEIVWKPGGYGLPAGPVAVTVGSESSRPLRGQSPTVWLNVPPPGGGPPVLTEYFRGRTIIYTHATATASGQPSADFTADVESTIVHELTHAMHFPHKCGYWDYRTNRTRSCTMNYRAQWLLEFDLPQPRKLQPDTGEVRGPELCARHAKEMRRTHLEDNPALKWK
jgi:hypothetical protein